jgi:tetratricopeptide (TPR) repeat protein
MNVMSMVHLPFRPAVLTVAVSDEDLLPHWLCGPDNSVMGLVADDLGAWLVSMLADAARRKLVAFVLGDDQGRALYQACSAALTATAAELRPDDYDAADEVAMVVCEVFKTPAVQLGAEHATLLEALHAGIAAQLAVLDDPDITAEPGWSSADSLGLSAAELAEKLTLHLMRQITGRAARGGPLEPLANQLGHDRSFLLGLRLEGKVDRLDDMLVTLLTVLDESWRAPVVPAAPAVLAQLPAETTVFAGRDDELAVLAGLLKPSGASGPVVVSAVAGLGGVGKTTLAIHAGHAAVRKVWFPGGVLFINLHGYDDAPVEPGEALDALLRALGVHAEHIPPRTEERAALYRSVLAQMREPLLVVADNASSEAQVRLLLPGTGPHKVLVTSRHALAGLGARLVDVSVLDQELSVDLLGRALQVAHPGDTRISGDPKAAGRLAGLCGGLPLALQITAALLIADPGLTAGELADQLEDQSQRLDALRYDDGSDISAPSVATAFSLSCRKLGERSARVFRLLALAPGPDVSTETVAVLADMPTAQVRAVLSDLAKAHLIERAPSAASRWRMHDLVRLYANRLANQHDGSDDHEQALDRLLDYWLEMAQAARDHLLALHGAILSDTFSDAADALAWLDSERASLIAAIQLAAATSRDRAAMGLPILMADYLDSRRLFDDKIAVMEMSLHAARRLGEELIEADALTIRGNALPEMRRFEEAITAHQDAIAIYRRVGGRRGEANALNNLALALRDVGRFQEEMIACQDAVAIYQELGDRHSEAGVLAIFSYALAQADRCEEAIAIGQDAVALYQEIGDRHGQAGALNNVCIALGNAHRYQEAIAVGRAAAVMFRETGDRHGEAGALNNLGLMLRDVAQFQESIIACEDAAAIYRETGDRNRGALALNNLGTVLEEVLSYDEAIARYRDAAAMFRETGDRHGEAGALKNLGLALRQAHRYQDSITSLHDATAIYRETGDRHNEVGAQAELEATIAAGQAVGQSSAAARTENEEST